MSTWFHYRSATTLLGRVSYPLHPYTLTLHLYTLALHPYTLTYFKPNGRLFYKFSMPLPDFPKNDCEGAFLERAKEKFKRKVKDKARTWIKFLKTLIKKHLSRAFSTINVEAIKSNKKQNECEKIMSTSAGLCLFIGFLT